ncbi:SGNH/GDSL hydrolase family protein [Rossellomorea marisflavi]|uniref:SGNH/GDSL hydrolase family protein n=1 Tax=Rossellomorea marisflavi TaxID=189381 RepID=UPI003457EDCB
MKHFLLVILALACGAVLILGNLYWQDRTGQTKENTKVESKSMSTEAPKDIEKKEDQKEEKEKDISTNWPDNAKDLYKKRVEDEEAFKISIIGSPALGASEGGWAPQLKETLLSAYGDSVQVKIDEWNTTSVEFVNSSDADDALKEAPDLVLWEPFTLVDNSNGVGPIQNHESILIFDRKLHEANEEATLILQPPHPIENATYYPLNVDELKAFAQEEGFTYLDHWSEWPKDDSLSEYLIDSQDTPNAKGYTLWKNYLADYFIED